MMLIKKQINEIEKEIVIKSKNQNLKKVSRQRDLRDSRVFR